MKEGKENEGKGWEEGDRILLPWRNFSYRPLALMCCFLQQRYAKLYYVSGCTVVVDHMCPCNVPLQGGPTAKSKPAYLCNNFVYCQTIFIIFGSGTRILEEICNREIYLAHVTWFVQLHYLVKFLITTFVIRLYVFITIHNNKYKKNLWVRFMLRSNVIKHCVGWFIEML